MTPAPMNRTVKPCDPFGAAIDPVLIPCFTWLFAKPEPRRLADQSIGNSTDDPNIQSSLETHRRGCGADVREGCYCAGRGVRSEAESTDHQPAKMQPS